MADRPIWYPPSQVYYPPELPTYLKNVCDLQPIAGVPGDAEVIGIHAVIQAANRVSGIPGMHEPVLLMGLADHLFGVQMARYRSEYSLIMFSSNATYIPPELPAHISVNLEPVSGAPSDEQMLKAHEALQSYQQFSHAPTMFDAHVNMKLSQHLFNLQMGENPQAPSETTAIPRYTARAQSLNTAEGWIDTTNNAGTGANERATHQALEQGPNIEIRELLERSNRLVERFSQLLEHSNGTERINQPEDQPHSQAFSESLRQVLERLSQLVEQSRQSTDRYDQVTEHFNQLFEQFNQLIDQSNQRSERANELAERANELANRPNQHNEEPGGSPGHFNQPMERVTQSMENIAILLKNINKVLVGIQHAIVRNHTGNTVSAVDCLVNERGEKPALMHKWFRSSVRYFSEALAEHPEYNSPVVIDGVVQHFRLPDGWLGDFLRFFGIAEELCQDEVTSSLRTGREIEARTKLNDYLSSCLG